jgi:hypothetical protein
MKVPGRAWLQFKSKPQSNGQTILQQTALFAPKGLFGLLYWYALYPIHGFIFSSMVQEIGWQAEALYHGRMPLEALQAVQRRRRLLAGLLLAGLSLLLSLFLLKRRRTNTFPD